MGEGAPLGLTLPGMAGSREVCLAASIVERHVPSQERGAPSPLDAASSIVPPMCVPMLKFELLAVTLLLANQKRASSCALILPSAGTAATAGLKCFFNFR